MNLFVTFTIVFCVTLFYLGCYVLSRGFRRPINRAFMGICLCACYWAFCYSFVLTATESTQAWRWYRISSIGWCNFAGFMLHFALILTDKWKRLNPKIALPLLYLPGIVFTIIVFSPMRLLVSDFRFANGICYEVQDPSVAGVVFSLYYALYLAVSGVVTIFWARRSRLKREKWQGYLYGTGVIATLVPALVVNTVLPSLNVIDLPAVGYLFGFFWIVIVAVLVLRYNMLTLSSSIAADSIMTRITEIIIITDLDGAIISTSRYARETLGYTAEEIEGLSIMNLIARPGDSAGFFSRLKSGIIPRGSIEVDFTASNGTVLPVSLSCSIIEDSTGDPLGAVLVGTDLRPTRFLRDLNQNLAQTNARLEEARREAEVGLAMAANLQRDFLPDRGPHSETWDLAFMYIPCSGVSGDLFDFYSENGEFVGAGVFDVSGHGLAPALITVLAKSIVHRHFHEHRGLPLHWVMDAVNRDLTAEVGKVASYLTGALLRFNGYMVEYANASHPDMLFRSAADGSVTEVGRETEDFHGGFLGIDGIQVGGGSISIQAEKGDIFLLYTDGFIDSKRPDGIPYGRRSLIESLKKAGLESARAVISHLMEEFNRFLEGRPISDDVTVLVFMKKQ